MFGVIGSSTTTRKLVLNDPQRARQPLQISAGNRWRGVCAAPGLYSTGSISETQLIIPFVKMW